MEQISIQYLKDSPGLERLAASAAAEKLLIAGDMLPINKVLIGWRLPQVLFEACRKASAQIHADLYRWHPLLVGDGSLRIYPSWQTLGLNGERVPGLKGRDDFTFLCPNHPEVQEAVQEHVDRLLRRGGYDGFFLDRIRFPSPARRPDETLACFCQHCQATAEKQHLDLGETRRILSRWVETREGKRDLPAGLLREADISLASAEAEILKSFLNFRSRSITDFVKLISAQIRSAGLSVGLDCFAPGLAKMVGQDLARLGEHADWIKIMTYAHTYAASGLPYELLGLVDWLKGKTGITGEKALELLSETLELPLPSSPETLRNKGIGPAVLKDLILRGTREIKTKAFAGIELFELEGVTHLDPHQIEEDLEAVRDANPDGLAISWDLRNIPLMHLEIVRKFWYD